jgi:hypothetical protein
MKKKKEKAGTGNPLLAAISARRKLISIYIN